MFNTKFAAVLSSLLLASSVASAKPADNLATVQSAASVDTSVDAQACNKPAYPSRWVDQGASGNVVVDVLVGTDGTVLESKLVQSSGYRHVDRASVRAVEGCKLKLSSAQAAPSWSRVKYEWVIE